MKGKFDEYMRVNLLVIMFFRAIMPKQWSALSCNLTILMARRSCFISLSGLVVATDDMMVLHSMKLQTGIAYSLGEDEMFGCWGRGHCTPYIRNHVHQILRSNILE